MMDFDQEKDEDEDGNDDKKMEDSSSMSTYNTNNTSKVRALYRNTVLSFLFIN